MTAKEARKLFEKAKEPETLKGVLSHIKKIASMRQDSYPFVFTNGKQADLIVSQLTSFGYRVHWDSISHPGLILLEVAW